MSVLFPNKTVKCQSNEDQCRENNRKPITAKSGPGTTTPNGGLTGQDLIARLKKPRAPDTSLVGIYEKAGSECGSEIDGGRTLM